MISNCLKKNWFYIFLFFVLLPSIFGIIYCILKYYLINLNLPVTGERLGQFGDYIGGLLNPILTFFSFLALLVTIVIQNKQLSVSSKELSTASEILKKNQTVMSEQLLTQSLQQFDSIFFAMLKDLNVILLELESKEVGKQSSLAMCHARVFNNEQYIDYSLKDATDQILSNRMISRYFMLLYQILKITNNRLTENGYIINEDDKSQLIKMYSNIVRASVSEEAMQLLIINALHNSFQPFKILLEKFNFFEHTTFNSNGRYSLLLINAAKKYDVCAFDQSIYWANLIQSNLFEKYIIKHNIITYRSLFESVFKNLSTDKSLIGPINYGLFAGYFCNTGINNQSLPIGLFLDKTTLRPSHFGRLEIDRFVAYPNLKNLITEIEVNQITITETISAEILIKIIFQDDCEVTYEISDLIKNFQR